MRPVIVARLYLFRGLSSPVFVTHGSCLRVQAGTIAISSRHSFWMQPRAVVITSSHVFWMFLFVLSDLCLRVLVVLTWFAASDERVVEEVALPAACPEDAFYIEVFLFFLYGFTCWSNVKNLKLKVILSIQVPCVLQVGTWMPVVVQFPQVSRPPTSERTLSAADVSLAGRLARDRVDTGARICTGWPGSLVASYGLFHVVTDPLRAPEGLAEPSS